MINPVYYEVGMVASIGLLAMISLVLAYGIYIYPEQNKSDEL